jgi:hypothetical protein
MSATSDRRMTTGVAIVANTASRSDENPTGWVLTFSSAYHLLGNRKHFIDYEDYSHPRTIHVLNATGPIKAVGEGQVGLYDAHGRSNILQLVLFVPNLFQRSYLSVRQLVQHGEKVTFDQDGWKVVFGDVLLFSSDGGIIPFEYTADINA